jgi:hypothetical protein
MADEQELTANGLDRRQLLTRAAIAGGLVWAAPIIRTTAAYATTQNGTERPCINFYMVVISPSGQIRPAPGNPQAHDVPPAIRSWFRENPSVKVQFPAREGWPQLTGVSDEAAAVLLPEVKGPNAAGRQCRLVVGWARKGNSYAEGYVDPNPPIAVDVGRRLLFPCPDDPEHENSLGATSIGASSTSDGSDSLTSDGGASATLGSDGGPSNTLGSDGGRSKPDDDNGGGCFSAIYLIYCCPR